jgi:hypothetical protein
VPKCQTDEILAGIAMVVGGIIAPVDIPLYFARCLLSKIQP